MATVVTAAEFAAHPGLEDWRYLLHRIEATFRFDSFGAAGRFVGDVANAADAADHHPDVDLRYPGRVHVALTTHASGAVTDLDLDLAGAISSLAAEAGGTVEVGAVQSVEIALDVMDVDAVRPFWAALLGYVDVVPPGHTGPVVDLRDPAGVGPTFWFQQMDAPRHERNRFHIDVTVPHDVAEERVAAALAAGGTLVTDRYARSWWVLADPEGNEACVCTWQDRPADD